MQVGNLPHNVPGFEGTCMMSNGSKVPEMNELGSWLQKAPHSIRIECSATENGSVGRNHVIYVFIFFIDRFFLLNGKIQISENS